MKILGIFIPFAALVLLFFAVLPNEEERQQIRIARVLEERVQLSQELEPLLRAGQFPEYIDTVVSGRRVSGRPHLTIEPHLQAEAEKIFRSYKPDFGAVVMLDAKTGAILAIASWQKDKAVDGHLALRASYPAASVFKIVTAAAAIDHAGLHPTTVLKFNGGNYTLYKRNVLSDTVNRWTRSVTLREAFARSFNTPFGRIGIEALSPEVINDYASRFMFNQTIPSDIPVEMGVTTIPTEPGFELAEISSGFTKKTKMSPVQGAMIAAAIINNGKMMVPYLVDSITDERGRYLYKTEPIDSGDIITPESARKVRELMEETIVSGTSRNSFRPLTRSKQFREIEMGGKTGHLTGDNPRGRVDWFVGYASDDHRKVAIAALTVNREYWTVKSSHIGQTMFRKYFEPVIKSRHIANEN